MEKDVLLILYITSITQVTKGEKRVLLSESDTNKYDSEKEHAHHFEQHRKSVVNTYHSK